MSECRSRVKVELDRLLVDRLSEYKRDGDEGRG